MRNEALKLWNTIYVYMWCKETFLLGGFKTNKQKNLFSLKQSFQWIKLGESRERERKLFMQKVRCLICLRINFLNTHIVAGIFSINVQWIEFQRPNILKSSLHPLMCQWRRVAVGLQWGKPGTVWDVQFAKLDHSKTYMHWLGRDVKSYTLSVLLWLILP